MSGQDGDSESAITIDETGENSAQSSLRTRFSAVWSTVSAAATSVTSFSSWRSRTNVPKLNLQIPEHSLSIATDLLADSSQRSADTASETPSTQISAIRTGPPQHLHGPATSTSLIHGQGILDPTTEASPQGTWTNSRNDPVQHLPPIEQAIRSSLPICYFVNGLVTSGTLKGLVQFLIAGFDIPGHTYYRDTFLTACSELTTPEDLFHILSSRLAEEDSPTSNDGFSKQYTIFLVIIYWLKSDNFPPKDELLNRINVFCGDAVRRYPLIEPIAIETCQLINIKVARPTAFRVLNLDEPILESSKITPSDLALALSLLEGDHYKALQPSDYLLQLTKAQPERIERYGKTNEKIRLWVIRSILRCDTASSRSEVMKSFIYTALNCYSMRNFSSTIAISSALHSVLIQDLKATNRATRKALPNKIQAKLPLLYNIINNPQFESNHQAYHDAIQAAATDAEREICIPWFPFHLKELDEVIHQPLTVQVGGHHLVNFDRYHNFMERVKEILPYSPPDLEEKRHGGQLTYLLNQLREIDLSGNLEQQLRERGEKLSARESDENLRRVSFAFSKSK